MIRPDAWLHHAGIAASTRSALGGPGETEVRRSISASYYSVFHLLSTEAAAEFTSDALSVHENGLFHRAFGHREMRRRCADALKSTLPVAARKALGRTHFADDVRAIASNFVELQDLRHSADYDPSEVFHHSDAQAAFQLASETFGIKDRVPREELRLFLLFLLFGVRST